MTADEFLKDYAEVKSEEEEGEAFEYLFDIIHKGKNHWFELFTEPTNNADEFKKLLRRLPEVLPRCGEWLPVSVLRLSFMGRNRYSEEWNSLLIATRAEFDHRGLDSAKILTGLENVKS